MHIVIADQMEEEVISEIKKLGNVMYKPADLNSALKDADALIVRSATKVTEELLSHAPKLRLVARGGVGLDNVDQEACKKRNIKVINTPGASTNAVAELALGVMLALFRNVPKAHHQMKNKVWDKKSLTGQEILGKTLGIIGFGRIGGSFAEKARAVGMHTIAYDPNPRPTQGVTFVSLEELFVKSDVISLHTILVPETRHMINAKSISTMKNGAFIINLARGELIDEESLYAALKSGKLGGAALDVYSQEPYTGKLLELDNVCLTPHIGAATKEAQGRIGAELVEILKRELKP